MIKIRLKEDIDDLQKGLEIDYLDVQVPGHWVGVYYGEVYEIPYRSAELVFHSKPKSK